MIEMELKVILYTTLILLLFLLNWFLFKKLIFRIGSFIILILVGLISATIVNRYIGKSEHTYIGREKTFVALRDSSDFFIDNSKTYSLYNIDDEDVPNRIKVLKLFSNQCNRYDSIMMLKGRLPIKASTYWLIKKDGVEEINGLLEY